MKHLESFGNKGEKLEQIKTDLEHDFALINDYLYVDINDRDINCVYSGKDQVEDEKDIDQLINLVYKKEYDKIKNIFRITIFIGDGVRLSSDIKKDLFWLKKILPECIDFINAESRLIELTLSNNSYVYVKHLHATDSLLYNAFDGLVYDDMTGVAIELDDIMSDLVSFYIQLDLNIKNNTLLKRFKNFFNK